MDCGSDKIIMIAKSIDFDKIKKILFKKYPAGIAEEESFADTDYLIFYTSKTNKEFHDSLEDGDKAEINSLLFFEIKREEEYDKRGNLSLDRLTFFFDYEDEEIEILIEKISKIIREVIFHD